MDPATAAAAATEAYRTGGIAAVLLVLIVGGLSLLWKATVARERAMVQRLDAAAKACEEREKAAIDRQERLVRDTRADLKELIAVVVHSNDRCADALHISARAFEKLSDSPSGIQRTVPRHP